MTNISNSEDSKHSRFNFAKFISTLKHIYHWLLSNHQGINVLASIFLGIASIYVSYKVSEITNYQTKIFKLQYLPIISFRTELGIDSSRVVADTLYVYNTGAQFRRYSIDIKSMLVVSHDKDYNKKGLHDWLKRPYQDEKYIAYFLPLDGWYGGFGSFHARTQGLFAYIGAPNNEGNVAYYGRLTHQPGRGRKEFFARYVQHLVRLQYESLLDENVDDYYIITQSKFSHVHSKKGYELYQKLNWLAREGYELSLTESNMDSVKSKCQRAISHGYLHGNIYKEETLIQKEPIF